jgi:hypothetical protein
LFPISVHTPYINDVTFLIKEKLRFFLKLSKQLLVCTSMKEKLAMAFKEDASDSKPKISKILKVSWFALLPMIST